MTSPTSAPRPPRRRKYEHNRTFCPIYTLMQLLGIVPITDPLSGEIYFFSKVYSLGGVSIVIGIFVWSIYSRLEYFNKYLHRTAIFTDLLSHFFLTFCNASAILIVNILNGTKMLDLFEDLHEYDKMIEEPPTVLKENPKKIMPCGNSGVIDLICAHIYFLLYVAYNVYFWVRSIGFNSFLSFMIRDLQQYFLFMTIIFLRYIFLKFKTRFLGITLNLKELKDNMLCEYSSDGPWFKTLDVVTQVKYKKEMNDVLVAQKLNAMFVDLSGLVDKFNDVFGWYNLFITICIVLSLLNTLNLAIIYADGSMNINGVTFGFDMWALAIFWASLSLYQSILLTTAGAQTIEEAQKVSRLCYKILYRIPNLLLRDQNKLLRDELATLAQQSTSSAPKFTAAGFFDLNYTTLSSVIASVTSYLIVLIQFK